MPEIHIDSKLQKKQDKGSNLLLSFKPLIIGLIIIALLITSGVIGSKIYKPLGIVIPIGLILIGYLIKGSQKNAKMNNLYNQMEKLMKRCCNDSYNDLALYFGTIYTNFEGELNKSLERCYMTAVQTNDSKKALEEFKSNYKDEYLDFCIDTLQTIKKNEIQIPTDYLYKQTKNKIGMTQESYSEQAACRGDILLFTILAAILVILLNFLFGMQLSLFFTPIGIVLSVILGVLFVTGLITSA